MQEGDCNRIWFSKFDKHDLSCQRIYGNSSYYLYLVITVFYTLLLLFFFMACLLTRVLYNVAACRGIDFDSHHDIFYRFTLISFRSQTALGHQKKQKFEQLV